MCKFPPKTPHHRFPPKNRWWGKCQDLIGSIEIAIASGPMTRRRSFGGGLHANPLGELGFFLGWLMVKNTAGAFIQKDTNIRQKDLDQIPSATWQWWFHIGTGRDIRWYHVWFVMNRQIYFYTICFPWPRAGEILRQEWCFRCMMGFLTAVPFVVRWSHGAMIHWKSLFFFNQFLGLTIMNRRCLNVGVFFCIF